MSKSGLAEVLTLMLFAGYMKKPCLVDYFLLAMLFVGYFLLIVGIPFSLAVLIYWGLS